MNLLTTPTCIIDFNREIPTNHCTPDDVRSHLITNNYIP